MDTENNTSLDFGSIDFTPEWARKDAGVVVGRVSQQGGADGSARPGGKRPSARKPGPDGRGAPRPGPGARRRPQDRPSSAPGRDAKSAPRIELDVKILPETKALGTVMRKLQQDGHAYKLKDLAYFFLDNPSSVLLKISRKNAPGAPAGEPPRFHQCKACGFASASADDVAAHVVSAHLKDYYDAKEIECEPPKGNFNCVAKCTLSGVLLGPPNIHEFNSTVREMIRTRYPGMSEAEYRSHIEMVRDPEAVEEWRKNATKKTVFLPKGAAEGAQTLAREQAESEFRRLVAPQLASEAKNLMITADVAMVSPDASIRNAARQALEIERRQPHAIMFALRGAFHNRKMHFFRANDPRGQEFVTGTELKEFDAAHAIPELAKVAGFIAAHPCSTRQEIAPDEESDKQLAWLVSTGHVVAFTNGVFSAVEKHPKYGPQWRKKKSAPAAGQTATPAQNDAPAEEPPAAATPAEEPPAAATPAEVPQAAATPAEVPQAAATPAEEPAAPAPDEKVLKEQNEENKDEASTQLA